jgi:DNA polymerase
MTAALALHQPQLLLPQLEPKHWVFLDLETYYDAEYSLRKMTTCDYVRDPRFETIGVAVFDGEERAWMEHAEFEAWAKTVPWHEVALCCHNTQFDGFVLAERYGVRPAFLLCTMSMARSFGIDGGVSLENLAERFGVGAKGKEVLDAKGKHRSDFTYEEWQRYGSYSLNDVFLMKAILDSMLADGFPESELWLIDQTIKMFTNARLFIDEPLLRSYLAEEKARKAGLLQRVELDRSIVLSGDKFAKELMELGIDPPMKLSPKQTNENGSPKAIWAFAKSDPGMQELLEHEDDQVRWLAEARIALKSTINETRTERFLRVGGGGRTVPIQLNYYGAHTGRWSGAGRMNPQNLERTNKKNPRKGILRKALLAPHLHKIVAADSGQIEARITAWLAGHESLVQGFRENKDIYSSFASEVYNRPVDRKNNPEDETAGFVGKICILGLGYGLGWQKLSQMFLQGAMSGPKVQFRETDAVNIGVDITKFKASESKMNKVQAIASRLGFDDLVVHCAVTDKVVQKYRNANEPIVQLWHSMEDALEVMLEDDESFAFGPNNCLRTERHAIVLPNGMKLRYPGLKYQADDSLGGYEGYSYLGQYGKQRVRAYGGSITENVVQALARIIVADQMLHVRAVTGFEPCLSTHDEWAFPVPDAYAPWALHVLQEAMKTPPAWAVGLPLHVEAGFNQSYGLYK